MLPPKIPEQLTFALTQRWRTRRERLIPANGAINRADYTVEQIRYGAAKEYVEKHHYAGRMTTCIAAFGLFYKPAGSVLPAALVGVIVFSVPINNKSVPKWTGVDYTRGAEIGRLVLDHSVPGNGESFLTTQAVALLAKSVRTAPDHRGRTEPRIRALITYSDPVARVLSTGEVIKPGHWGIVYQACSMTYQGTATARGLWLNRDGHVFSDRTCQKIRQQERGCAGAEAEFIALGAPPRTWGESPTEWIRRALAAGPFVKRAHPGNHTYAWGLDHGARRSIEAVRKQRGDLPYPKPDRTRAYNALSAAA